MVEQLDGKLNGITQRVLGGPINVSPAEEGRVFIQRGENGRSIRTDAFVAQASLEEEERFLNKLDKVIDISSDVVVAGGALVSIFGLIRRNPTVIARGLGIAAAGLITAMIENPAKIAVQTQLGYREDAAQKIDEISK